MLVPLEFEAHVQYDDWLGTAAADNADQGDIWDLLRSKKLIDDGEFLIAWEFGFTERVKGEEDRPWIRAFVINAPDHKKASELLEKLDDPIPARAIKLELKTQEFFDLFKRLNVCVSLRGLRVNGREMTGFD
jgi:hypothetical protein